MSIRINCKCGTTFMVSPEQRGQTVVCPDCGKARRLPLKSATSKPAKSPTNTPLDTWKTKRDSTAKSKTLWLSAVGGLAVLGLILGILFLPNDSEEPKTTARTSDSPTTASTKTSTSTSPTESKSKANPSLANRTPRQEPNKQTAASNEQNPTPSQNKPPTPKPRPVPVPVKSVAKNADSSEPVVRVTPTPTRSPSTPLSTENDTRSREEVLALIAQVGRTPPDWYEATRLNYPKTLDLSWPQPPPKKGWNNQKNVGQFIWDVINPNPGRWQQGVRLMHHLLGVNKTNRQTLGRIMTELGRMYHELLLDYPRAAFWYRQAGIGQGGLGERNKNGAHLAECYWRLGNREMAVELLEKLPVTYASIKLWGDLGETEKSIDLARRALPNARFPAQLHLMIGDAQRLQGEYQKALKAYQDALSETPKGGDKRQNRFRQRASANIAAIKAVELLELSRIPDGTYRSSSIGYEGPVEIEVRIQSSRIDEVRVTKHKEKQFYSSIEATPRRIIQRQGIKNVDTTSGATITSEAIINATAKALVAAMKN